MFSETHRKTWVFQFGADSKRPLIRSISCDNELFLQNSSLHHQEEDKEREISLYYSWYGRWPLYYITAKSYET